MNENGNLPVKSHRQRPTTANGERAKALLNRVGIIRFTNCGTSFNHRKKELADQLRRLP
jgi:hypothetical protein